MRSLLLALPPTLHTLLGDCMLTAWYGQGAHLHTALLWQPMSVRTDALQYFIEDSLDPAIITPGESDLLLLASEGKLSVLFCHEGDIHVDGTDTHLIAKLIATEPLSQVCFRTRVEIEAAK